MVAIRRWALHSNRAAEYCFVLSKSICSVTYGGNQILCSACAGRYTGKLVR